MTPLAISVVAPGLVPDYKQVLELYKLVRGYRELRLSQDARRTLERH